ncbi:ABC transporter ATP-binding protein [Chthonobacter albigriseus]|uniref:ABC transporter ATP-binding protein n=1 Tax=Chthonobacter albigriseus TaxID=1683161 RepID=UPI0015EF0A50|nr:ABC transporter ATP-binding protein [Chthonobacter albigriseus]
MSRIEVRDLEKRYDDAVVLERMSLTVESGSFCALVGASGCGKTTFLKIILGQEQATKGTLTIDGAPIAPEPDPDRGIVFQRYSVFPHLTALQNLILVADFKAAGPFARTFGVRRKEARVDAEALLERVGLAHARNRYPAELSGGMQQRLAIAQTLLGRPKVLLLDEPFGALDPGIRGEMHDLLREIWDETRMTILMVTHDISEAFKLADRILVFDKIRRDPQAPTAYGAHIAHDVPNNPAKPPVAGDLARVARSLGARDNHPHQPEGESP